ncbi:hypothetical protein CRE_09977 [Caenorhabditis remanei]|uniref:Uncharacterized protein n=2 Tax=Caenorhabditis remanei TaxID=31234 RepID=E3M6L8_CAERE|nr:hypothetical protein CRE_09977 [Caenorhabditis remanei]
MRENGRRGGTWQAASLLINDNGSDGTRRQKSFSADWQAGIPDDNVPRGIKHLVEKKDLENGGKWFLATGKVEYEIRCKVTEKRIGIKQYRGEKKIMKIYNGY